VKYLGAVAAAVAVEGIGDDVEGGARSKRLTFPVGPGGLAMTDEPGSRTGASHARENP